MMGVDSAKNLGKADVVRFSCSVCTDLLTTLILGGKGEDLGDKNTVVSFLQTFPASLSISW